MRLELRFYLSLPLGNMFGADGIGKLIKYLCKSYRRLFTRHVELEDLNKDDSIWPEQSYFGSVGHLLNGEIPQTGNGAFPMVREECGLIFHIPSRQARGIN